MQLFYGFGAFIVKDFGRVCCLFEVLVFLKSKYQGEGEKEKKGEGQGMLVLELKVA